MRASMKAAMKIRVPHSIVFMGALVACGSLAGCITPLPGRGGTCEITPSVSCTTILAGDKDAGVDPGLVGYHCTGTARPDDSGKVIQGIPYGQVCAAQAKSDGDGGVTGEGDFCCSPENDLANCVFNPQAICPEGYGYQCWGPNRPDVNNPGITCGNGIREGDLINYCCQAQGRPVGCTQAKGAFDCKGGLIGWVCPEGFRPRGEDFGANESRADYYYFVCGVPTPAPNPDYSTYCCFTPSPKLPGGSCVYNPGVTQYIPTCGPGRFGFACYGRDTPQENYLPIRCQDAPVDGISDDGYPAKLYCCDYVPPGVGSGTGGGLDEED
jgi:hypothetical protein